MPEGPRLEFNHAQRKLLLQLNMARNGGKLKSDDPQDPYPNLGDLDEQGTANAPEIDHIVPKSHGGSNFFSNARVVSWALNNKHDRIKSLMGLVDLTKRKLPVLSTRNPDELADAFVEQSVLRKEVGAGRSPITPATIAQWAAANYNEIATTALLEAIEGALAEMAAEGTLRRGRKGAYFSS